ncbi:UNVERIFIED_CONTAM: hypothetical protein RF648_18475, partial [Kocuria sp. CPCC 205274]
GAQIGFKTTGTDYERFSVNPAKTIGTYTIQPLDQPTWVFESFYVATQIHTRVTGTNHVYLVDNDIMRDLTTARFVDQSSSDGGNVVDFGQFIINLIQLPFKVPANYVGTQTQTIRLGNHDTQVAALPFMADLIKLDMGEITVPATSGDTLDFANTVAMLHLPYVPPFAVDLQYVMGQTLSIIMNVDVYNGKATVLLESSAMRGESFYQKDVDLGIKIPYANLGTPGVDNDSIDLGAFNNVTTPFIELLRNEAVLPYSVFRAVVPDEGRLLHAQGFIAVDEVLLESDALHQEQMEIINLLKDGVYFK